MTKKLFSLLSIFLIGCSSCLLAQAKDSDLQIPLTEVARSERQWTGVAISQEGRIFVNYPRWSESITFSVGELTGKNLVKPFPNEDINNWVPSRSPKNQFICVQSVYVDANNFLWVLDAANPKFQGVIAGGTKLIKIDLKTNQIIHQIFFSKELAPSDSYLNDVRVDTFKGYAYITDSGEGAILVINLKTGKIRRLLDNHPSTTSENTIVKIDGKEWRFEDGTLPQVHSDGIALSPKRDYLYYQALTGRSLYRIATRWLQNNKLSDTQLAQKVELVTQSGVADGIAFGPDGYLYLSALEQNAIKCLTPKGKVKMLIQNRYLAWPDSFAIAKDGTIYVTTSQIHLGGKCTEPYKIFKFKP